MKKRVSVLFAAMVIASLVLAGCSSSKPATSTTPAPASTAPAPAKQEPAKTEPAKTEPAKPAAPAWKPTKPVEITVLFGAGSAADLIARTLAEGISKEIGQPMPVVNRTGGGGAVGYTYVKGQPAEGYSLVWNSNSISTAYYAGNMKMTHADFEPVARVSVETSALSVKAGGPFKTLKDLVEYAKANPKKIRIGNSGIGSHTHLTAVAFAKAAGIEVVHVPFGQGLAVSNLLGGQIEASVQLPAEIMSQYKGGQVTILGIFSEDRDPNLKEIATVKEQGFSVAMDLWRGIAAPKGTPKEVIQTLEAAIKKVVESPAFAEQGAKLVFKPAFLPADKFAAQIAADDKAIADLMTELGLNKQK